MERAWNCIQHNVNLEILHSLMPEEGGLGACSRGLDRDGRFPFVPNQLHRVVAV